jgi:heme A synthase
LAADRRHDGVDRVTALHAWGGWAVVGMLVIVAIVGIAAARTDRANRALEWLGRTALAVIGVTILLGAALLLTGARPAELLHLLYGVLLLGTLPLAQTFAAEAPARSRAAVVAGAALIGLILCWRLFATG